MRHYQGFMADSARWERFRLRPGDVIITPGRTPHLWADIESDMRYLVFRPDPDGTLTLK